MKHIKKISHKIGAWIYGVTDDIMTAVTGVTAVAVLCGGVALIIGLALPASLLMRTFHAVGIVKELPSAKKWIKQYAKKEM